MIRCECGRRVVVLDNRRGRNAGWKARKSHDKCRRCWRAIKDHNQAEALGEVKNMAFHNFNYLRRQKLPAAIFEKTPILSTT